MFICKYPSMSKIDNLALSPARSKQLAKIVQRVSLFAQDNGLTVQAVCKFLSENEPQAGPRGGSRLGAGRRARNWVSTTGYELFRLEFALIVEKALHPQLKTAKGAFESLVSRQPDEGGVKWDQYRHAINRPPRTELEAASKRRVATKKRRGGGYAFGPPEEWQRLHSDLDR